MLDQSGTKAHTRMFPPRAVDNAPCAAWLSVQLQEDSQHCLQLRHSPGAG